MATGNRVSVVSDRSPDHNETRPELTPEMPHGRCKRDGVIRLHPLSHPRSHPRSHQFLSKPLIPLTKPEEYMPSMGPGKGSGEKRGATHRKTGVLRTRQVFLRHTRRAGSLPSEIVHSGRTKPRLSPAQVVTALGFRILTCSISVPKNCSNVCDTARIAESVPKSTSTSTKSSTVPVVQEGGLRPDSEVTRSRKRWHHVEPCFADMVSSAVLKRRLAQLRRSGSAPVILGIPLVPGRFRPR